MFKFLRSKHRGLYCKLGFRYCMSPDHVRKLALGKEYVSKKEQKVHDILRSKGLIRRYHYHDDD